MYVTPPARPPACNTEEAFREEGMGALETAASVLRAENVDHGVERKFDVHLSTHHHRNQW